MMDIEEAMRSFHDFENRASNKRSTQIDRIKEDRAVMAGDQWSKDDRRLVGRGRVRRTINVTNNAVNAVVNNYIGYPYAYFSGDAELDGLMAAWLKTKSNERAIKEALSGSVAFGLSYLCIGTDTVSDMQGSMEIPVVYTVPDVANIYYDPDSVELDGSDAIEAAIVELRSKNYVKARYGEEFTEHTSAMPFVNVSSNKNEDVMAIVTYYKVEDGSCVCYRMIGDQFLQDPVDIGIDRVPIIPVYGEQTWDDDEIIYQGIVRKATPVQRLINMCFTQLGDRMAMSPKPVFMTTPEAIEGYSEGYKTFQFNINPLALYNDKSADGKRDLPPPVRMDNKVEFGDLTGIISSNLELMASITGVDSRGMFAQDNKTELTATEVLSSEKQYQTNIRHYFDNLRSSFKTLGELVLKLLGYGEVTLEVTQGPDEQMQRQVARNELITLAGIVPDQQKTALVDGILLSSGNNAILRDTYARMHQVPAPTAMEEQMGMTIEQMKAAIEERDQKMQEMQQQLDFYEKSTVETDKNNQNTLLQKEIDHRYKQEDMILQAQLDQGLNADKAMADAQKAEMDLERQAIQLDTTKVKAMAEQTKAVASMMPKPEVTNENRF
jgi:hypothetical protein